MEVYIAKAFDGAILGVYGNRKAAQQHLEDLSVFIDEPHDWRNDHLYTGGRYAGRVEIFQVEDEYTRFARGEKQ